MASKVAAKAVAAVVEGGPMPLSQKHTLQSKGLWEGIRRLLAIDPNRSNGVPLNPHFRFPSPGAADPRTITDPVTMPAGDIAGNPYWKRDARRNYARLSVVNQADAVALLSVGSAAAPKAELVGEAGSQALVAAAEAGKTQGLGTFLATQAPEASAKDLFVNGLPPIPSGQSLATGAWNVHPYTINEDQTYPSINTYPCRTYR